MQWQLTDLRSAFNTLPGYVLLLGALPAVISHLAGRVGHALFNDNLAARPGDSLGTQGLQVLTRGALAGIVGGLVFTVVMLQIGFLPTVSGLVGFGSTFVGAVLHLAISAVLGIGYGVLFIRRSNDPGSALGWGVSYGALWWMGGPLTLLPIVLGDGPMWTIEAAREAYPALVGHLAYGAFLGLTFYRLEARHSPWWIPRNQMDSERAERTVAQLRSSAPALWLVVVLITVALPVLLGTGVATA